MAKCRWCRRLASRSKFRNINGVDNQELNCIECFNKTTEELLEEYGE